MKYYCLAAEANHPQALYNLGLLYMDGSPGLPTDYRLGLEMLQRAADLNLIEVGLIKTHFVSSPVRYFTEDIIFTEQKGKRE